MATTNKPQKPASKKKWGWPWWSAVPFALIVFAIMLTGITGFAGLWVILLLYVSLVVFGPLFPAGVFMDDDDPRALPGSLTFLFFFSALFGAVIYWAFFATAELNLLRWLIAPRVWRPAFIAVLSGALPTLALVILFVLLYVLVNAQLDTQHYGMTFSQALENAWQGFWGASKRAIRVHNGKAEVVKKGSVPPNHRWYKCVMAVDDGHVVVTERGGAVKSIYGHGKHQLGRHEEPTLIVPLRGNTAVVELADLITKDGMKIDKLVFKQNYKVDPGTASPPEGSQFAYSQEHIYKLWRFKNNFEGVRGALKGITGNNVREVISQHTLDEIFTPANTSDSNNPNSTITTRRAVINEVNQRVGNVIQNFGLMATGAFMDTIEISSDIEAGLKRKWLIEQMMQALEKIPEKYSELRDALEYLYAAQYTGMQPYGGGRRIPYSTSGDDMRQLLRQMGFDTMYLK